ncbi:mitochondrial amidoxime-reducing component 1-like isoform X2 [Haliotis asinina]|uniref:mitochondrial amidoxime-reducing component 1-like isoform X2 n=1 Tax=Haliotis asinina TaxID=109174 RepID=UPI0035327CE9
MFAVDINQSPLGLFSFFIIVSGIKLTALSWLRKKRSEMFECVGRVHALYTFPVKSCGAIECQEAQATPLGLSYQGLLDRIYGVNMDVIDCGDVAASWLNTFLGYDNLRLVYSPSYLTKRDAADKVFSWTNNAREGDMTAFSYLTSYLMTSASSLHDLNQRLDSPISMLNFRPNIAIEGTPPFDEDNWLEVKIGDSVMMRVVDVCGRCPITTIDPTTGEKDPDRQPLTKLKTYRRIPPYGSAPVFGIYCALETGGRVQVGDRVYVMRGHRIKRPTLSL